MKFAFTGAAPHPKGESMTPEKSEKEGEGGKGPDLLPCPFCGAHAFMQFGMKTRVGQETRIDCLECMTVTRWFGNEEQARAAWNRRSPPPPASLPPPPGPFLPFGELLSEYQSGHDDKAKNGECRCKLCRQYEKLNWDLFLPPSNDPGVEKFKALIATPPPPSSRIPKRIFRNKEGERCATCDGTHAHVHGYDDRGEVPGHFDGSDWPTPPPPVQEDQGLAGGAREDKTAPAGSGK